MSNYSQTTNFTALTTAHAVINGAAFDLEYGNVSTAITSKFDNLGGGYTGPFTMNAAAATTTLTVNGVTGYSALKVLTAGIQVGAPTGGETGVGTINVAGGYYVNGVSIASGNLGVVVANGNGLSSTRTSTTTLSNDANLKVAIPGAGVYQFYLSFGFAAGTGANGGGFAINYSGSFTQQQSVIVIQSQIGGVAVTQSAQFIQSSVTAISWSVNGTSITPNFVVTGTLLATGAGQLALSWAQGSSSATASTVSNGILVATRYA